MGEYNREDIFSKSVRAGRRTYFFDVRSTRAGDYYLTITESKRDFNEDGTPFYKKHKIYLYKEDFTNFKEALSEVTDFIIKEKGEEVISEKKEVVSEETSKENIEKETKKDNKTSSEEEDASSEEEDASSEEEDASSEEKNKESTTEFTEVDFDDLGKK